MKTIKSIKVHEWVWFGGVVIIGGGVVNAWGAKAVENLLVSAIIIGAGVVVIFISMGLGKFSKKPVE